ncbi:MAG: DUF1329 domain-containing protein [Nevskiaceae bacterium]|nr:MAG: DUF1329 domain-containing protein [Nevskiaceae bacterium]
MTLRIGLRRAALPAAALMALAVCSVNAKAPEAQVRELDGARLTCIGAERAGSASGVAAYTGKWLDGWPGLRDAQGYDPGPYAAEHPLYTVTADNQAKYADQLGDGQKALLRKQPKAFRMPVYASHRDFRLPDWACAAVKQNAASAQLVHDGLGTQAVTGAIAFPFPQSGLEAIWNVILGHGPWNETATIDIADVFPGGRIAWGKQRYMTLSPYADPARRRSTQDTVAAYFWDQTLLPERDKGAIGVGFQPTDFKDGSTHVWAYNPGIRRVRQAADINFDYPTPPSGLRTVDDDLLFNGSPERYSWKLLGKREMLIPYHAFRVNDPAIPYKDLLTEGSLNPDVMRYELHRVWVIEGTLKPGLRHVYGRRVLYVDEDTWHAVWADNYDVRGQLWRTSFIVYRYAPDAQAWHRGVSVFHDLLSGAYEAGYLVNEAGRDWWRLNRSDMNAQMFSPDAATRQGH